jgi:uncharacterized protein (DUF1015 family)
VAKDLRPAFYVYQQAYTYRGAERVVSGFACLVKIHDYADGVILPHEQTLAKPKSGLLELMRRTRANLDSIYSLFDDPTGAAREMIASACAQPPDVQTLEVVEAEGQVLGQDSLSPPAGNRQETRVAWVGGHLR